VKRLTFVVNNFDFLVSHRLVLAKGAIAAGYEVHAIGPESAGAQVLESHGVKTHGWNLSRKGQRVGEESKSVGELIAHFHFLRPDIIHNVTIKPVLYGSLAAKATGVKCVVNAVSGLGYVFMSTGWKAALRKRAVALAYRRALTQDHGAVILQNDDDEADLRASGALSNRARVEKIRGSGVDLTRFVPSREPAGRVLVALPARLLKDKGVLEFVAAARLLKKRQVPVTFALVGSVDEGNPASISQAQVQSWVRSGIIEHWGHQSDMPAVFKRAHIVCLPSYREGLPKVLLEAGASERAVVTTDVPGCRDVVSHEKTGLLVQPRNAPALALAIERLVSDRGQRHQLATALRNFVVARHDEQLILKQHLSLYESLLSRVEGRRSTTD
jgi:glycosyltransferase involved in cell wall biosynthesis